MSSRFDVTAIVAQRREGLGSLPDFGQVKVVPLDVEPKHLGMIHRARAGLGPDFDVRRAILEDEALLGIIKSADLCELQWPSVLGLARPLARAFPTPVAYVAHDIRSQALVSQAMQTVEVGAAFSAALKVSRALPQEIFSLRSCGMVWTFKPSDSALVRRVVTARTTVGTLQPLLNVSYAAQRADVTDSRSINIGFVADMGKIENCIALKWFVKNVWLHFRSTFEPGASLRVIGAGSSAELQRELSLSGVIFDGWVDELDRAYDQIDIAVAPMRVRGGIKFKVAEALAHQVPMVASSVAVEGYPLEMLSNICIARTPRDWVDALAFLSRSAETRSNLAARGHAAVIEAYDFEKLIADGLSQYESLMSR